ncbi:MAG TPA: hypothetical protein PLO61_10605 [Fimbriimonadaceae bacterium]|nr:hypothetical protein [Fimbriimonadaceae bacterium]HRJ34219.1 hypothetical protein [Fimbriimonadaceae bacterium]
MKKWTLCALVAAMASLILAGCAPKQEEGDPAAGGGMEGKTPAGADAKSSTATPTPGTETSTTGK